MIAQSTAAIHSDNLSGLVVLKGSVTFLVVTGEFASVLLALDRDAATALKEQTTLAIADSESPVVDEAGSGASGPTAIVSRDGETMTLHRDSRGDPYRDGVSFAVWGPTVEEDGADGATPDECGDLVLSFFLERDEAKRLAEAL